MKLMVRVSLVGHPRAFQVLHSPVRVNTHCRPDRQYDRVRFAAGLDAAFGIEPHDSTGWVERGRARLATDLTAALADFEKALELEPKSIHALLMKAYVLKRQEKYEACLAILERTVEAPPENAHARSGRGLLNARFKNWEAAETDAKEALFQDASPQIVYQVVAIYGRISVHNPAYRARAADLLTIAVKSGIARDYVAANSPRSAKRRNSGDW